MKKRSRWCFWLAAAELLVGGCDEKYLVEMTPQEGRLHRRITCRVEGEDRTVKPETAARLAAAYGQPPPADPAAIGSQVRFEGVFALHLPADVGGKGLYVEQPSLFGTTCLYVERWRGQTDSARHLQNRLAAADHAVALVRQMVAWKFGQHDDWPSVDAFLRDQFGADLREIALLVWLDRQQEVWRDNLGSEAETADYQGNDMAMRIMLLLIERGYLPADRLAPCLGDWGVALDRDTNPFAIFIETILVERLGLPADSTLRLAARAMCESSHAVEATVAAFLAESPTGRELVEQWQARQPEAADQEMDPLQVVGEPFARLLLPEVDSGPAASLSATLRVPVPPLSSNGAYDQSKGIISWAVRCTENQEVPVVLQALWVQPDEAAQARVFGRILVSGWRLASYCTLEARLPKSLLPLLTEHLEKVRFAAPGWRERLAGEKAAWSERRPGTLAAEADTPRTSQQEMPQAVEDLLDTLAEWLAEAEEADGTDEPAAAPTPPAIPAAQP